MRKFTLVENAADSLEHVFKHLKPINHCNIGDWKRLLIDLAHVVELLSKERLRRIHPAFIYEDVDKYPTSVARTVGAEKAFKRLKSLGGLEFSEEDAAALDTARGKRNEIEHFEFSMADSEAKVIVGQVLSFVFRFAEKHLGLQWKNMYVRSNYHILVEYAEFYESLLCAANSEIEEKNIDVIICPSCNSETFGIIESKCFLCGHEDAVFDCRLCGSRYCLSATTYGEEAMLCKRCEWDDGYAASHHEKY